MVAKCLAMANEVSDLPSPGPALVSVNVLGIPFSVVNCRAVHRDRWASRQGRPRIGEFFFNVLCDWNNAQHCKTGNLLDLLGRV